MDVPDRNFTGKVRESLRSGEGKPQRSQSRDERFLICRQKGGLGKQIPCGNS